MSITTYFPQVSGKNLNRERLNFPKDLPAKINVILMAFYRYQQDHVDTWLPFVASLEERHPGITYFEFPVVYKMGPVRQFMLNEGMRAGIPDEKAREKTVTLYLNKSRFLPKLEIYSEDQIQILAVDNEGKVLWHEVGLYSEEKGAALEEFVTNATLDAAS